jgi:hypothetical protein
MWVSGKDITAMNARKGERKGPKRERKGADCVLEPLMAVNGSSRSSVDGIHQVVRASVTYRLPDVVELSVCEPRGGFGDEGRFRGMLGRFLVPTSWSIDHCKSVNVGSGQRRNQEET